MPDIVALTPITGGINLLIEEPVQKKLGLTPGKFHLLAPEEMERYKSELLAIVGDLPIPSGGGSVANTLELLARLGLSCGVCGLAGDDEFGRVFVSRFQKYGIRLLNDYISDASTGYDFYLETKEGLRTILYSHGVNACFGPEHLDRESIQKAKFLLVDGGLLKTGIESRQAIVDAMETALQFNVEIVLTLSSSTLVAQNSIFFQEYGAKVSWIAGNMEQFAALLGFRDEFDVPLVVDGLKRSDFQSIVTHDAKGAYLIANGQSCFCKALEVEALDSTGAGDNFLGAFLYGQSRGLDWESSLELANFVAAQIVQVKSARFEKDFPVAEIVATKLDEIRNS